MYIRRELMFVLAFDTTIAAAAEIIADSIVVNFYILSLVIYTRHKRESFYTYRVI